MYIAEIYGTDLPRFTSGTRSFSGCNTRWAGMNKNSAVLVYLFQIYNELGWVMLGIGHNLCTKERNNMI